MQEDSRVRAILAGRSDADPLALTLKEQALLVAARWAADDGRLITPEGLFLGTLTASINQALPGLTDSRLSSVMTELRRRGIYHTEGGVAFFTPTPEILEMAKEYHPQDAGPGVFEEFPPVELAPDALSMLQRLRRVERQNELAVRAAAIVNELIHDDPKLVPLVADCLAEVLEAQRATQE